LKKVDAVQGFCAETAGAMTLFLATSFGVPVSTTHTITGAIMGVGAARKVSAVRWGIADHHRLGDQAACRGGDWRSVL
jgi:PiT family inorganic phosphate transporter